MGNRPLSWLSEPVIIEGVRFNLRSPVVIAIQPEYSAYYFSPVIGSAKRCISACKDIDYMIDSTLEVSPCHGR